MIDIPPREDGPPTGPSEEKAGDRIKDRGSPAFRVGGSPAPFPGSSVRLAWQRDPPRVPARLRAARTRGGRVPTAGRRRGCFQRRPPALRACPAARRRALAPTTWDCPRTIRRATPSPRAPGRGRHGLLGQVFSKGRDDPSSTPSLQWFHGLGPAETRWGMHRHAPPPFSQPSEISRHDEKKTAGQRLRRGESAAGGQPPNGRPCDFFWSRTAIVPSPQPIARAEKCARGRREIRS